MAKATSLKTKVSTKGQVVLPKAIRDKRGFGPGVELIVEERPEGVLLRPSPKAEATRVEDVFGRLGPVDRIVSIEEMNEGVLEEARRGWLRKTRDSD
jgi:AbrB family looped-hinge helix DNA binding protein